MLRLACCMLSFALWPMTASADPVTECHRLAADPNDPGRIGTGVAFDAIESAAAVTACLQAVDANPKDGRLAYELGRAYDAGSNFAAAENAYLRSDDLGFDLAKRNLGYLYKDGRGAEPNPKQAERWLRAAAKNGDADAMNALAWMWVVTGERGSRRSVFRVGQSRRLPKTPAIAIRSAGSIFASGARPTRRRNSSTRSGSIPRARASTHISAGYTRPSDALRMRAPNGGAHSNSRLLPRPTTLRSTARRSRRR